MRFLRSLPFDRGLGVANDGLDADFLQPWQDALTRSSKSSGVDLEGIIDDYFKYYHTAYPLLREGVFRACYLGNYEH